MSSRFIKNFRFKHKKMAAGEFGRHYLKEYSWVILLPALLPLEPLQALPLP